MIYSYSLGFPRSLRLLGDIMRVNSIVILKELSLSSTSCLAFEPYDLVCTSATISKIDWPISESYYFFVVGL